MTVFFVQRVIQAGFVLLAISLLVFLGVYAVGNPIDVLAAGATDHAIRAETIARYGLDRPIWEQYWLFLTRISQGDFGQSFVFGAPVLQVIFSRLPATVELTLVAVLVATSAGTILGMYAGYRPHGYVAKAIMALSALGFSVPTFWIAILLIFVFAVQLGLLPAGGRGQTGTLFGIEWSVLTYDGWRHLLLPVVTLCIFKLSLITRLASAGTREIMQTDTIKFARAAGLSEWAVMRHHVLKLISIPIVTVFGLELGTTLAFAIVTETIFSWPGVGKLIIDSINNLDRPVMVAYLVLVAVLFIIINFVTDISYRMLDPRVSRGKS